MTSDIAKRQRTVPTKSAYDFNWKRPVQDALQAGAIFDRYDEETNSLELACLVRVDPHGMYIYWKSEGGDGQALDLCQVSDVRLGSKPKDDKTVATLAERGSGNLDERVVTICSGLDLVNTLYTNMIAMDPEVATIWIQGLRSLTHNTKASNVCPMTQLRKHWVRLCLTVNPSGNIPVRTISKTFASGKTEKIIFQSLKELGLPSGKNDEIEVSDFTFEKFYELYHMICPRTDIEELFKMLSDGKDYTTTEKMIEFLNETQRDPRLNEILFPFANENMIKYIIDTYEPNDEIKAKGLLSIECFYRYLMSDDNAPVFLDRLDIYMDMCQPMCHYYINSSHNTYLTGRQFGGKSSVEMYRQVLLAGCRCIELDCWDGKGEDQEPIITHGKAMCTDILFREVMYAIRDTAFVTSDCPVILSFENHCSKPQQYKLAHYCEEILGDFLLTKPIDKHALESGVPLPSPEKLKRKVLIKNKRLKAEVENQQLELFLKGNVEAIQEENEPAEDPESVLSVDGEIGPMNDDDVSSEDADSTTSRERLQYEALCVTMTDLDPALPLRSGDYDAHPEVLTPTSASRRSNTPSTPTTSANSKIDPAVLRQRIADKKISPKELAAAMEDGTLTAEEEQQFLSQYRYTGATTNIHPYLSSLVNYAQPVKFQGFDIAEDLNVHYHMSSYNENMALGLLKKAACDLVDYNKRQMSRIYPRGNRVDSSNFMPQIFWNAGSQMVALNFQTPDLAMQLNQGKFEYNGNCGFLLKPEFMRRPERSFDPFSESPMDGVIAATCEVKILSGQFLSDKKVGTFVEVDMYGLPTDTIRKEFRTRVVPNNGLNPVYGDDSNFVFRKVVLPDLAVLRIAVYEETGKLIGQRVLPLDGLQSGYRHISLRTEGNFPLALSTIFCMVTLTTYVPEGLAGLVDALSDPKAYLSREEKRVKQMANMGCETDLIVDVPATAKAARAAKKALEAGGTGQSGQRSTSGGASGSGSMGTGGQMGDQNKEKKDEPKFEAITVDTLNANKAVIKILKRQSKELEAIVKRQEKEASGLTRGHTLASDKLNATYDKQRSSINKKKKGKGFLDVVLCHSTERDAEDENASIPASLPRKESPARQSENGGALNSVQEELEEKHKTEMTSMVCQQTEQFTNMRLAHLKAEEDLKLEHLQQKRELIAKLMQDVHEEQKKVLKNHQEREVKRTYSEQTKHSMESSKSVMSDNNFRNKAERDRRIRELYDYNTKRFIEERRTQQLRHERQTQVLAKRHDEQLKEMQTQLDQEKEQVILHYAESRRKVRPTIVV